ncbi:MAG: hypothetical protein HWD61_08270 [Parachlamydiaceae bacterium]|nr:MAG: hypothetical protein HWD61_08270 [Parachlamydiaceae bacterium]
MKQTTISEDSTSLAANSQLKISLPIQKECIWKSLDAHLLFFTGKGVYTNEAAKKLLEQNIHGDEILKKYSFLSQLLKIQDVANHKLKTPSQTFATLEEKHFHYRKKMPLILFDSRNGKSKNCF